MLQVLIALVAAVIGVLIKGLLKCMITNTGSPSMPAAFVLFTSDAYRPRGLLVLRQW
jgi:hypothetical protein